MNSKTLLIGLLTIIYSSIIAQIDPFEVAEEEQVSFDNKSIFEPQTYQAYQLNEQLILKVLDNINTEAEVFLPLADGKKKSFVFKDYKIAAPSFYEKFASIKTFEVISIDGKTSGLGCFNKNGFHLALFDEDLGQIYIDPSHRDLEQRKHVVYKTADYAVPEDIPAFVCDHDEHQQLLDSTHTQMGGQSIERRIETRSSNVAVPLRRYILAVATTGEYSRVHSNFPTKEATAEGVMVLLTRVNEIQRREFSIEFELMEGTERLFFLDEDTDPFTNGNTGALIGENFAVMLDSLSLDDYDIGHVFCTNAGGLAQTPSVCTRFKSRGVSCSFNVLSDRFYTGIVCHEFGHQMNAQHSFNQCDQQNENISTGYEPGSGSTIMSYAGLCGSFLNVQNFSDPYYNIGSVESIMEYMHDGFGSSCSDTIENPTNTPAEVEIVRPENLVIPISTPFELEANATDLESSSESLYYCWEQHDAHTGFCTPGMPTGNCPLFRSFPPVQNNIRVFPEMRDIITGNNDRFEVLPTYSRSMEFSVAVRDWSPEGGVIAWDYITLASDESAGPFAVEPLTGSYEVGDPLPISWDVANTNEAPVNCQFVDIYLSTDGGETFPHLIAKEVPNVGFVQLSTPNIPATDGMIKIKASNNVFFNLSRSRFEIQEATEPTIVTNISPYWTQNCLPNEAEFQISSEAINGFSSEIRVLDVDNAPAGFEYTLSQDTYLPGDTLSIFLNLDSLGRGTYNFDIVLEADGDTTVVQAQVFNVVNDFDDMAGVYPANNAVDININESLSWEKSVNALSYILQVSKTPAFDAIEYQRAVSDTSEHKLEDQLEVNEIYYWRVLPVNECGAADATFVHAFRTIAQDCESFVSTDVPVNIGTGREVSSIEIEKSGTINDLNIRKIQGTHPRVSELTIDIVSPEGTSERLWRSSFCNNSNFNFNIDDEATDVVQCQQIDEGRTFLPRGGDLANFDNQNYNGLWQLVMTDETPNNSGRLENWELEICVNLQPVDPEFRIDTLFIGPNSNASITADYIFAEQENVSPSDITYTIVETPELATIELFNAVQNPGSSFNQDWVNRSDLKLLTNDIPERRVTYLSFSITDPLGGWSGIQRLPIVLDPELPSSTKNSQNLQFSVFPNPVRDILTVNLPKQMGNGKLEIYNIHGQLVQAQSVKNSTQIQVNCAHLPSGLYFIKAFDESRSGVKRIIVK